ncbi:MAG: ribonuclease H-like domain-containing protein [Methanoregula sp.]|nr:ribonuclease H-like domain-containing protein [Methanoregula sp.]
MMPAIQISPGRIGSLWQQRMDSMREYEVVRDGNVFATSFSNSIVFSSEYDTARQNLTDLLARYNGCNIDSVFSGGREEMNEGGTCYLLESHEPFDCPVFDQDRYQAEVLGDLTLVHGIGKATEKRLKLRGYQTLKDLAEHPKFRQGASTVMKCISTGNSREIMKLIGSRHPKSHSCVLGAAGLHEPEDYIFFDIETMGLFSRPIILFGVGILEHGELVVRQYLLRDIAEEPAALLATMEYFSSGRPALVTFNGKAFDAPYLADRLAFYGMGGFTGIPHFDVLHFSRRHWKDKFPSLRLATLEKEILDVHRSDDIPGQMVPEFYEIYLRTGNCGPLVPVIEHNRQDVVSLARLFFHLLEDFYGYC